MIGEGIDVSPVRSLMGSLPPLHSESLVSRENHSVSFRFRTQMQREADRSKEREALRKRFEVGMSHSSGGFPSRLSLSLFLSISLLLSPNCSVSLSLHLLRASH